MFSALCPQCGAAFYQASCPRCGMTLYGTASGQHIGWCMHCAWSGLTLFQTPPSGQVGGQVGGVMVGSAASGAVSEPNPLDVRRDALRARLDDAAAEVNNELRCLAATEWDMPAWRRYERLQEAHAALYRALGGVRMGEYHPARGPLDEALVGVLLWALLTLDGVER